MTLYDTTLVDGVDMATLGCLAAPYEAPYTSAPERGDLSTYSGVDGVRDFDLPLDVGLYAVNVSLSQQCQADGSWKGLNDAFRALRLACKPGRRVTLTRRMEFTTGQEEHTASARLLDLVPTRPDPEVMECLVEFRLLDGCFFGASEVVAAFSSSSPSVKGHYRTLRITATLSSGAASPTVENTLNDYSFSYVGSVPTGGVSIDVLNRRATKVSDSSDVSGNLRWAKSHPFRLEPGANPITVSSGTVAFSYQPAYL
jgi:hypothetical protein